MTRRAAWVALLVSMVCACDSDASRSSAPSPTAPTARLLVVTHTTGFRHGSIPTAEATIESLGRTSGAFTVTYCRTAADVARLLTPSGLTGIDAVVFANTTGNLGIPDLAGFLQWIADGHGFAGMHSASDTYHDAPTYFEMLGNEFLTHGAESTVDAIVENASHPASAPIGARFRIFDEIYKFTRQNRSDVTMLLSLDRHPLDGLPDAGQAADLPLAWARTHVQGRVFYTALGHRDDVWQNPTYQQHILAGLRWVSRR
jgi:type 1 glutamine amidotransferase